MHLQDSTQATIHGPERLHNCPPTACSGHQLGEEKNLENFISEETPVVKHLHPAKITRLQDSLHSKRGSKLEDAGPGRIKHEAEQDSWPEISPGQANRSLGISKLQRAAVKPLTSLDIKFMSQLGLGQHRRPLHVKGTERAHGHEASNLHRR